MKHRMFGIVASLAAASAAASQPVVGQPAPAFRVTAFDGREIALADYRGKVVVLNFWATWCVPCRVELPLLDNYLRIQEKNGLRVVAVTTEDSVPLRQLKPLAAVVAFPMARRFRGKYGNISSVPLNFVIDRAGVLRYAKAGAMDLDTLNAVLIPLLREPEPAGTAVAPAPPPP